MSAPPKRLRKEDDKKFKELRNALKETVLNLESVIEGAERVLRRARERLDLLSDDETD